MLNRPIVLLLACGIAACSLSAAGQTLNSTTPLQYVPLETPCRALGTAVAGAQIPASSVQTLNPAGGACNIPQPSNGIIAYAINVTVTPQEGYLGYLVIWPAGDPTPPTSTVNSWDGRVKTNAAIVAGGSCPVPVAGSCPWQGEVNVFANNPTGLTLDVSGYFTSAAAYVYVPITPCRLVDTRINNAPLLANQTSVFPLVNNPCKLPPTMLAGGEALSLNVTALPRGPSAEVKVWGTGTSPTGPEAPSFPTLIVAKPFAAANAAIVTMEKSASDSVSVSATTDVDLVMDITGYFASAQWAPSGLSLYLLSPCRVLDTRFPPSDGLDLQTGFSGKLIVPLATENPCSVPRNAQAYLLNATVIPLPALDSLTLWADSTPQPVVSTLNVPDADYPPDVTSNMAIVGSFNGSIDAFAGGGNTHLILDVSGYFNPGP
jgi:hypothetical protein